MLPVETRISSNEAAARSGTYRLLARLWLREVDRDLVRALCSPPLYDSFVAAGGSLPASDDAQTIEQLAIDYCRLFVGPQNHLPPFQSVWQDGQFQGVTATPMKSFVEVVGYDTGALPNGMMLDHLGVQLDVMGQILGQCAAWQPETEGMEGVWELAHAFFRSHLRWPTALLETAARRATTQFYRSAIRLTGSFLESEASQILANSANPQRVNAEAG